VSLQEQQNCARGEPETQKKGKKEKMYYVTKNYYVEQGVLITVFGSL
jgi:hypothetical protein